MANAKPKTKTKVQTPALVEVSTEPPTDQYEQLNLAVKHNTLGNDHQAVKILIEVVRGLL
jgi:hypothetical protein